MRSAEFRRNMLGLGLGLTAAASLVGGVAVGYSDKDHPLKPGSMFECWGNKELPAEERVAAGIETTSGVAAHLIDGSPAPNQAQIEEIVVKIQERNPNLNIASITPNTDLVVPARCEEQLG